jgi:hypothetical protein
MPDDDDWLFSNHFEKLLSLSQGAENLFRLLGSISHYAEPKPLGDHEDHGLFYILKNTRISAPSTRCSPLTADRFARSADPGRFDPTCPPLRTTF